MTDDPGTSRTFFDTPERTTPDGIASASRAVSETAIVATMLEAFPMAAVVLEENRQIVAANARALALFGVMAPADVHGLRMGEAFGCICSHVMEAGCGTALACAECGSAHAVREGREHGTHVVRECRITINPGGKEAWLDLRVAVHPLRLAGREFLVAALEDIADEKRRAALEHTFFHDVLGAAISARGLSRMLSDAKPSEVPDLARALVQATSQVVDEVAAQRDLRSAEQGHLTVAPELVVVREVLENVGRQYRLAELAKDRHLLVEPCDPDLRVQTDRVRLLSALGNLVRNALEAADRDATVTVSARAMADGVLFQVSNPEHILPPVQRQIFQRSFSTKAARGRGLGTYSVKLIVEQYLNGRVSFVSSPEQGTVFSIWLHA